MSEVVPADALAEFGWAPGFYTHQCVDCGTPEPRSLVEADWGEKRSWRCRRHAEAAYLASIQATPHPHPMTPASDSEAHTPTPWREWDAFRECGGDEYPPASPGDIRIVGKDDICVGVLFGFETIPELKGNAPLVIRAVNSHAALVEALEAHDAYMLDAGYEGPESSALHPKAAENWRRVRTALAAAKGETPSGDKP